MDRDPDTGRFAPGNPGGPGRPLKSLTLSDLIRRKLAEPHPDDPGKTWGEMVVESAVKEAADGKFQHFKELLDRTEGKVPERLVTQSDRGVTAFRDLLHADPNPEAPSPEEAG